MADNIIVRQNNFSGGETTPDFQGHSDLKRYATSMRTLQNWFVTKHAVLQNRPGFGFVGFGKSNGLWDEERLIPFIFSDDQAYVLEMFDGFFRVIKDGAVLNAPDGAAAYNAGTTYAKGDICLSGNVVWRSRKDGNVGHTPALGSSWWLSNGSSIAGVEGPLEVESGITDADLPYLKFAQNGDTLSVVSRTGVNIEIVRRGDTYWEVRNFSTVPDLASPTGWAVTAFSTATLSNVNWKHWITAIGPDGRETVWFNVEKDKGTLSKRYAPTDSAPSGCGFNITFATDPTPSAVAYRIYGGGLGVFGFMAQLRSYPDAANPFIDDGSIVPDFGRLVPVGRNPFPVVAAWQASHGYAQRDVVTNGGNTYECVTAGTSAGSGGPTGYNQDITDNTAHWRFLWTGTYKRTPAVVAFHEQRRLFANTEGRPASLWGSALGNPWGFEEAAIPPRVTDPFELVIAGTRFEEIRWLASSRGLVIGSASGVWFIHAGDGQPLSALNAQLKQLCSRPCAWLEPLAIGSRILFLQDRANVVRELKFNSETETYDAPDIGLFSSHLFENHTIVRWAYASVPNSIVYAMREDGVLLCLTYIPEQDVYAWSRIVLENAGVEDICVVPEGGEDVVYVVLKRQAQSGLYRTIERLHTRYEQDPIMGVFVDCAHVVQSVTDVTTVTLPDVFIGETVSVVVDGAEFLEVPTVHAGDVTVTLPIAGKKVIVGLPYTCIAELLDVVVPNAEVHPNQKLVDKVTFDCVQTRGVEAGEDIDHLTEWPSRNVPMGYGPPDLVDGQMQIRIASSWNTGGRAMLVQRHPFAATITSISRDLTVGDND